MNRPARIGIAGAVAVVCAIGLCLGSRPAVGAQVAPAAAPPAAAPQDPGVVNDVSLNLNLDGAPLEDMIELVSRYSKKIFLYQDRIKQVKIYSIGSRRFRGEDLYGIFQSILELNGFALVTIARGTPAEVVKVVEARNTRRYPTPVFRGAEVLAEPSRFPTDESVVTVTHRLMHTSAREVSNALRPLLDPNTGGQIIGLEGSEVLVLTDFAPNVWRLLQIIEQVDVPARAPTVTWELVVLRPEIAKASAAQVAEQVARRAGRVAVIPFGLEGTGAMVVCGAPEDVRWMVGVMKAMDQGGAAPPIPGAKPK